MKEEPIELKKTREDVIDLLYRTCALERKAECRENPGFILDSLEKVKNTLVELDGSITDFIEDN